MQKHLFLVFTRPSPGQEAEYNDWYDNEHLADVLKVPGVTAAQRFAVAPMFTTPGDVVHGYLAIYERTLASCQPRRFATIATPDIDAARVGMAESVSHSAPL